MCCKKVFEPVTSLFCPPLVQFLQFSKDILHIMLNYARFLGNSSLRITLLIEKHYFMPVKRCCFWVVCVRFN